MRIDFSSDAATARFLMTLRRLDQEMARAQRMVASGRQLEVPSDNADSVSRLLQLRAGLKRLEQGEANLRMVETEVDAAESALSNATSLMDRVSTLAAQGANSVTSAETRQILGEEVGDILKRLVALANTQSNGRYIFSGNNDLQPAYVWDDTATPPWGAYQGTAAQRQVEHPTGSMMTIAKDAREIFDSADPSTNVFVQVQALHAALVANDEQAVQDAIAPLAEVTSHLNSQLSFYGNVQSRVLEALDVNANHTLRLQQERAGIEDVDLANAIVLMQELQFRKEASLQVQSGFPKRSLFDYLG